MGPVPRPVAEGLSRDHGPVTTPPPNMAAPIVPEVACHLGVAIPITVQVRHFNYKGDR